MRLLFITVLVIGFSSVSWAQDRMPPEPMPPVHCEPWEDCHVEEEPEEPDEPVFCTMDAKLCPDGSYVSRQGPNCEFAPCPGEE